MNERIKEIADQASLYASRQTTDPDEWEFIFRKKFAELIVKECVMLCDKVYEQNDNVKIQAGATFCREDIKKQFGVE